MRDSRHEPQLERRLTHRDGGYTLIELILVVLILGILTSVVVMSVSGVRTEAAESGCDADRRQLHMATEAYFAQFGGDVIAETGLTNDRYELTLVDVGVLRAASDYYDLDADGIVAPQEDSPC